MELRELYGYRGSGEFFTQGLDGSWEILVVGKICKIREWVEVNGKWIFEEFELGEGWEDEFGHWVVWRIEDFE